MNNPPTSHFYGKLPKLHRFSEITRPENFVAIPEDWLVAVTDVKGSTRAIEAGRYKEVNTVGALSIVSLLNLATDRELPFIFGGDGSTILLPPEMEAAARSALVKTAQVAQESFELELRVGVVPMAEVLGQGHHLRVAKVAVSPNYQQAAFLGDGMDFAEKRVKDDADPRFRIDGQSIRSQADFSGLECRWQDIPSSKGETLSLMVQAVSPDPTAQNHCYETVMATIERILGPESARHPVRPTALSLSFSPRRLAIESRVRSPRPGPWGRMAYLMRIAGENLLGAIFMQQGLTIQGMPWGQYKNTVAAATDFQKFDGMLRMIIAASSQSRNQLRQALETMRGAGKIFYGLHVARGALMTCLVFQRNGRQVHFVDGADGGYALAAKEFKAQLAGLCLTAGDEFQAQNSLPSNSPT